MTRMFVLAHDQARRNAASYAMTAPDGLVVTFKEATRNLEQNALLHALLTDVAAKHEWAGSKRGIETWKRLLTAAWLRARGESIELLPALDGHGVDVVFRRTSSLTKAECSELVEFIHAWTAMHTETV